MMFSCMMTESNSGIGKKQDGKPTVTGLYTGYRAFISISIEVT